MKKASIILNIALILVSMFFVVFANIQTDLAMESQAFSDRLAQEAIELQQAAQREAANAREAEAEKMLYRTQLEECQSNQ